MTKAIPIASHVDCAGGPDVVDSMGSDIDAASAGPTWFKLDDESVTWRIVDGKVVALDLDSSAFLTLNESGTVLWGLLSAGTTRRHLVNELVTRFDVTLDKAGTDVDAFLQKVDDLRLIRE